MDTYFVYIMNHDEVVDINQTFRYVGVYVIILNKVLGGI